jgi:hypothetical protein
MSSLAFTVLKLRDDPPQPKIGGARKVLQTDLLQPKAQRMAHRGERDEFLSPNKQQELSRDK